MRTVGGHRRELGGPGILGAVPVLPNSRLLPHPGIGTLTKFTLVLYGTAPEGPHTPPESSGCKTLTTSQACVGQWWWLFRGFGA